MKILNKNLKRDQELANLCALSALRLTNLWRLVAKCSFARMAAIFNQVFQSSRLAFGKRSLCTGKANPKRVIVTSSCLFPFHLPNSSSTGNLSWFVSTQDSEIVYNFTPLNFCFNFFAKIGLFSARQASFKISNKEQ